MSLLEDRQITGRRLVRKANFHLKLGEHSTAKEKYQEALEYIPDNIDLLLVLSKLEENTEVAINYLRDALSIRVTDEVKYALADCLMQNDQYEEALDLLQQLNLDRDDPLLIVAKIQTGANISEIDLPRNVTKEISPYIGAFHHRHDNHAKALKFLRSDYLMEAKHMLGIQHLIMGNNSTAKKKLDNAMKMIDDTDSELYYKVKFDYLLTYDDPEWFNSKVQKILTNLSPKDKVRAYEAMFVKWFNSDNKSEEAQTAKEWLQRAKDLTDDEFLIEKYNNWEGRIDE